MAVVRVRGDAKLVKAIYLNSFTFYSPAKQTEQVIPTARLNVPHIASELLSEAPLATPNPVLELRAQGAQYI